MSLRTPLGRVMGLGSAKDGTAHWWAQRLSAMALALLGLWFVGSLAGLDSADYATARTFVAEPLNTVLLSLLFVTMSYHSYLGVQVVIEDYVHAAALKVATLVVSRFAHVLVAAIAVYAILRIGLGG